MMATKLGDPNYVRVEWQVDDGYAGGSRPQRSYIPRSEWDAASTEEERDELVDAYVEDDFSERISWFRKAVVEQ